MQALPAAPSHVVLSSTQKGAIYRDVLQVAEKDYKHLLRSIALEEVGAQAQMGNKPTGMIVDGRRGDIEDVTRSIVVWFADRKSMSDAIIAARDALVRAGRSVTGRTIGALSFYYSVGAGGAVTPGDPAATAATIANPHALDLYVTLPLGHVRKWQWMGAGGQRLTRRSRNKKWRYLQRKQKPMVSRSVFEIAQIQTQRRFRSLDVEYIYLSVQNLNPGGRTSVDRIPAIKVRMKVRGRGH